ncbi:MAG: hypothetical protein ACOY33_04665 [Pseudomonadota bacterium]
MSDDKPDADAVVDLARLRERLTVRRQERNEAELAARFHDAMGWQGKPDKKKPAARRKKTGRKKP